MSKSTLTPPPEWSNSKLVGQLEQKYRNALDRVYNFVRPLLKARPLGGEEFTDHDLDHAARVAERIASILPKKARLNQAELYILLVAVLLHDFGMWTPKAEALALLEDDNFLAFSRKRYPGELEQVQKAFRAERWHWMAKLGLQRLAAMYHRTEHPKRFAEMLLSPEGDENRVALGVLIDEPFVEPVAAVIAAHGWRPEDILDYHDLRPREVAGELVNLRYLAELLRLGDLLDLGEGRISSLVWHHLYPMNLQSEAHWRKEATLRMERCEPDLIRISGTFDVDRDGTLAAEAYALACDWLGWLNEEILRCALILPSRTEEPELAKRCQFGKLKLERTLVRAKGLVLGGELSFELDRDRVLKLLGDEIYSQGCIFVRELLQNAVDATRAQMVRDCRDRIRSGDLARDESLPWEWPHEITGQDQYAITVETGQEEIDGAGYQTYRITDQGIGMTTRQLSEHFVQIGRSYYQTTQYSQEFRHAPISQFGIGFLSCLMVADRIEVLTRTRDDPFGLRLWLRGNSRQFTVEKAEETPYGTTVKLWLDPARERREGWDRMPIGDPHMRRALGLGTEDADFGEATRHWGLWLELAVVINGEKWGPRDPSRWTPRLPAERPLGTFAGRRFPVRLASRSGRPLATGAYTAFAYRALAPPMLLESGAEPPYWVNDSVRGIWTDGDYLGSRATLLLLNFSRMPRDALSASRRFRRQPVDQRHLIRDLLRRMLPATYCGLASLDAESAAIWRLSIRDEQTKFLEAPLPCRVNDKLEWLTLDDAVAKHGRVLLVPFGVAWKGALEGKVACVGLPSDSLRRLPILAEPWDLDLYELPLVSVEDLCTAYLWPASAGTEGLSLLKASATYVEHKLLVWRSKRIPRVRANAVEAPGALVDKSELPDYDRDGNPWDRLGLLPEDLLHWGKTRSAITEEANEVLRNLPDIELPEDLLDITLDIDDSDWR